MIELSRINGTKITINPFQIEFIEETNDTVILFNSGRKMVVKDSMADIYEKFAEFLGSAVEKGINKARGA